MTRGPPPHPPTSRDDLWLDEYLEYPHAAQALYLCKHPCLLWYSNPGSTAQKSASLTTIPNGCNTVFGYIASGSIPVSSENKPHCGLIKDNVDLEKTMRRFWEIENVEPETIKNKETIIYQRKLQRILWRENMDEPIKTFELSTVTYGTTSAPFLATRTLKQLALDEAGNFLH
ncbi:integrase catalytic domain-containing protein [Trichonephila clavipes]|nr:integrase catalytic domain-containing protein [Trichonephila clavipes]